MPVLGELAKNPPGDPQKKKSLLGLCEKPSVSKVRYFIFFCIAWHFETYFLKLKSFNERIVTGKIHWMIKNLKLEFFISWHWQHYQIIYYLRFFTPSCLTTCFCPMVPIQALSLQTPKKFRLVHFQWRSHFQFNTRF